MRGVTDEQLERLQQESRIRHQGDNKDFNRYRYTTPYPVKKSIIKEEPTIAFLEKVERIKNNALIINSKL